MAWFCAAMEKDFLRYIDCLCHYYFCTPLRVFHTSVSWWFFTGIWMTVILFRSPGVFSVFWPISTMLYFLEVLLVLLFPSPPVPVPILWWLYQVHQLQLLSPSLSCSIVFFQFSSKVHAFICLFAFFQFYPVVSQNGKVHYSAGSVFVFVLFCFCCWQSLDLVIWSKLGDPFVSQNPGKCCASHFSGRILGCANTICSYDQIQTTCMCIIAPKYMQSKTEESHFLVISFRIFPWIHFVRIIPMNSF